MRGRCQPRRELRSAPLRASPSPPHRQFTIVQAPLHALAFTAQVQQSLRGVTSLSTARVDRNRFSRALSRPLRHRTHAPPATATRIAIAERRAGGTRAQCNARPSCSPSARTMRCRTRGSLNIAAPVASTPPPSPRHRHHRTCALIWARARQTRRGWQHQRIPCILGGRAFSGGS